jgi:hypothetical protein
MSIPDTWVTVCSGHIGDTSQKQQNPKNLQYKNPTGTTNKPRVPLLTGLLAVFTYCFRLVGSAAWGIPAADAQGFMAAFIWLAAAIHPYGIIIFWVTSAVYFVALIQELNPKKLIGLSILVSQLTFLLVLLIDIYYQNTFFSSVKWSIGANDSWYYTFYTLFFISFWGLLAVLVKMISGFIQVRRAIAEDKRQTHLQG